MKNLFKIILFLTFVSAQRNETIALFRFIPSGISTMESGALTNQFGNFLESISDYQVLDDNLLKDAINSNGYNESSCNNIDCFNDIGNFLKNFNNVSKMVFGSISKTNDNYNLTLTLFDLEKNIPVSSIREGYSGNVDGLLIIMELMAWKITGQDPPKELQERLIEKSRNYISSLPKQKSRLLAVSRSLLIPGWGQLYLENKPMAFGFFGAELLAIGAGIYFYSDYIKSYDRVNDNYDLYLLASSIEDQLNFKEMTLNERESLIDHNDMLTKAFAVAGLIHFLNILNTIAIEKPTSLASTNINLFVDPVFNQPKLSLSIALD